MVQGKPLSSSLHFQFHFDKLQITGNVSHLLMNTESDRVVYYFGKLLCILNG